MVNECCIFQINLEKNLVSTFGYDFLCHHLLTYSLMNQAINIVKVLDPQHDLSEKASARIIVSGKKLSNRHQKYFSGVVQKMLDHYKKILEDRSKIFVGISIFSFFFVLFFYKSA